MKLKTIALHLAYDLGSAAIGLAADKLRSGIVQRQNAPKAQGGSLQEIRDPFEVGPIKVNARATTSEGGIIAGLGRIDDPVVVGIKDDGLYIDKATVDAIYGTKASPFVKIDGETYIRSEFTPGKLELEQTRFVELTDDDVSAINYAVTAIYGTRDQKGPTAVIKREDLTKIYSILLKLQHKAAAT